jgi:CRISPR/Cas system Type II protein with McrA/HNH and RuvC-like nuclease domain
MEKAYLYPPYFRLNNTLELPTNKHYGEIFKQEELVKELKEVIKEQAQTFPRSSSFLKISQSKNTELEERRWLHSENNSFPPSRDFGLPLKSGYPSKK